MTSRSELRQTRRNLSPKSQRHAAKSLCRIISCQLFFQRASQIVLYMPVDGEISPMSICHLAIKLGKECYLPGISNKPAEAMEFRRYIPGETPMHRNQFGILEPKHNARHTILPWMPEIVFIPLVGFDTTGNRIGMGKGGERTMTGPLPTSVPGGANLL